MPPPNLVDLECLNNTRVIFSDAIRYLKNENQRQNIQIDSFEFKKTITVLRKTRRLISVWIEFISENSCLTLLAYDIGALVEKIVRFKNLVNNFQRNLSEYGVRIVVNHLSFLRTSAEALRHFLESLSHVTISSAGFNELPTELSRYIKVGEKMKDAIEISEIKTELQSLRLTSDMYLPSIFMAIVGPSYMGKTQSAFTLSHLMTVFYVNLLTAKDDDKVNNSNLNRRSQEIYAPFKVISGIFKKCLIFDFSNTTSSRATNLGEKEFQTLGLIYFLLTLEKPAQVKERFLQYINIKNIVVPKMTTENFESKIRGKLECIHIHINYFYSFRS